VQDMKKTVSGWLCHEHLEMRILCVHLKSSSSLRRRTRASMVNTK
jgi:hypothetical protein